MKVKGDIKKGIRKRISGQKILLKRYSDDHGFKHYQLSNESSKQTLTIPYFLFGRFRTIFDKVRQLHAQHQDEQQEKTEQAELEFNDVVTFRGSTYFEYRTTSGKQQHLEINGYKSHGKSSGYIKLLLNSVPELCDFFYHENVGHPSELLDRILAYHRMFQFTFSHESTSIKSDLKYKRSSMTEVLDHVPKAYSADVIDVSDKKDDIKAIPTVKKKKGLFDIQQRLGEKFNEKDIKVDYESVFGAVKHGPKPAKDDKDDQQKIAKKNSENSFMVPLDASDIKRFEKLEFEFELSIEASKEFRDIFLVDKNLDFYLGFEIIDALYNYRKTIKSFRFPLYYLPVKIRESGRNINLSLNPSGEFFFNHLAIVRLIEKFSDKKNLNDEFEGFFDNLLSQELIVDENDDRVVLARCLPVKETVFDRTREILLGYLDENGKGGVLDFVNVKGFESDLNTVNLYRCKHSQSPIVNALDLDLAAIDSISKRESALFFNSLLGKFLNPEKHSEDITVELFEKIWIPGYLPESNRKLISALNNNNLVLLEGPPGTGKTHTIMNLLINCVCAKKRVLVVSDQVAAVEALHEKMQDFLSDTNADAKLLDSAIKIIADYQVDEGGMTKLIGSLGDKLQVAQVRRSKLPDDLSEQLEKIDQEVGALKDEIRGLVEAQRENSKHSGDFVLPKSSDKCGYELDLIKLSCDSTQVKKLFEQFIMNRYRLADTPFRDVYDFFELFCLDAEKQINKLNSEVKVLKSIAIESPKTKEDYLTCFGTHNSPLVSFLRDNMEHWYEKSNWWSKLMTIFGRRNSPVAEVIDFLLDCLGNTIDLLAYKTNVSEAQWSVIENTHKLIKAGTNKNVFIYYFENKLSQSRPGPKRELQEYLAELSILYERRNKLVQQQFLASLYEVLDDTQKKQREEGSTDYTRLLSLMDSLSKQTVLKDDLDIWLDFKNVLGDLFPFWVVRKQLVPLLLPCVQQSFDLVVIDEATQCRVDDSLPLLYRAKKLLAVGDDKQTVLAKNSPIDDYLFRDFELDEHLKSAHARAFKGGGSNFFMLLKSINQSYIMLDEHYRCPADIIDYSNQFVYKSELKVMQWQPPGANPSILIELDKEDESGKAQSGKFKGIDTGMIDRFFDFIEVQIKQLEKDYNRKIDVNKDTAICYFLLKNEPYVKHVKPKFLQSLNRGSDILDGAGAALQGKERDFMFYLWDITRHNLAVFGQGDEQDKRKGELNVLMSRPKKKAFHYLPANFHQLNHSRTSITQYLADKIHAKDLEKTQIISINAFSALLQMMVKHHPTLKDLYSYFEQDDIARACEIYIGGRDRSVSQLFYSPKSKMIPIAVVDAGQLTGHASAADNICDYYFQLLRAVPKVTPLLVLPNELFDPDSRFYQKLTELMSQ